MACSLFRILWNSRTEVLIQIRVLFPQIPRYIITLHDLLAHTPYDHVERKSLQNAKQQLEDLSRQMHDEVLVN